LELVYTLIFQSAKLGDLPHILEELQRARSLLDEKTPFERVYGLSGGALTALAYALARSAQLHPRTWSAAATAIEDMYSYLMHTRSRNLRRFNLNPWYGVHNLNPLRRWLEQRLLYYSQAASLQKSTPLKVSDIPFPLYLCSMDHDGRFIPFGPLQEAFQFQYFTKHIGPPKDAPLVDALMAALSTMLSTEPVLIHGDWQRDCRPAIVNAAAIVADMQDCDPRNILRSTPHAPIRPWKQNWLTSSFIMHSQNERNQVLLAEAYLDLRARHLDLQRQEAELLAAAGTIAQEISASPPPDPDISYTQLISTDQISYAQSISPHLETYTHPSRPPSPVLRHIDLPYIGSTEAATNMRQSVENKAALLATFQHILDGQLDGYPFDQPANVIYGAGGFSGILAGLTTTNAVDKGFASGGGKIQQIFGVSAGVLNGFFHAVQEAARQKPELYRAPAQHALQDLEDFISQISMKHFARINTHPARLWQGFGNLDPLENFLQEKLAAYTGSDQPEALTFDDIQLPLTIAVARRDGFTDFLGMTSLDRHYIFAQQEWHVRPAPVIKAILAGWSMNTYIQPTRLGDQTYTDGGGTFYDIGLFAACLDPQLTNLINIHLDEPEGYSYNFPPRPHLLRILFDTHNFSFPEERRRMRLISNLLYQHEAMRRRYARLLQAAPPAAAARLTLPPDFRRTWWVDPQAGAPSNDVTA